MHYSPPLTHPSSSSSSPSSCSGSATSTKAKGLFQFIWIAFSELGCVSQWCAENRCQFWAPSDSFLCFISSTSVLRCQAAWSKRLKMLVSFFPFDAISEHLRWALLYLRTFKHSVCSPRLPRAFEFEEEQIYTAVQNHPHNVVPRFLIAAVGQLLLLLENPLEADLSATAYTSTNWNHFSLPDCDVVEVKFNYLCLSKCFILVRVMANMQIS